MNLDPNWHLDVDLTLDATTQLIVRGTRCDHEAKRGTGANLKDLLLAFTADHRTLVATLGNDPTLAKAEGVDLPGGFERADDLDCANETWPYLRYIHDDGPSLLVDRPTDVDGGTLDATELVVLEGVQYTDGEPIFYFDAGFKS